MLPPLVIPVIMISDSIKTVEVLISPFLRKSAPGYQFLTLGKNWQIFERLVFARATTLCYEVQFVFYTLTGFFAYLGRFDLRNYLLDWISVNRQL